MRALCWDGSTPRVAERPAPEPAAERAIVRVQLAGVCNTDLEIARGYMGFRGVLGHEFVGRVEQGPDRWCGRRVVGEINFACGRCRTCRSGLPRHCPDRSVMGIQNADGAFAEYVSVPTSNLHEVPDSLDDACAVFTEPLAAAFEILEQVQPERDLPCTVLGDGKLGLLVAQTLSQAGLRVLAVGRHRDKLRTLRRRGIATVLERDWNHERAPLVVEATGSERGFELAMAATLPRGRLVLKSTLAEATRLQLAPLVIDEIQVIGSRCGPFAPALAALEDGRVSVRELVSDTFALAAADAALRRAGEPGVAKVLIDCGD